MYDFYIYEGYDETEDIGTSIKIGNVERDSTYSLYPDKKLAYILKGEIFEDLIQKFPNKSKSEIFIEYKRVTMSNKRTTEGQEITLEGEPDDDVLKMAESLGLF